MHSSTLLGAVQQTRNILYAPFPALPSNPTTKSSNSALHSPSPFPFLVARTNPPIAAMHSSLLMPRKASAPRERNKSPAKARSLY